MGRAARMTVGRQRLMTRARLAHQRTLRQLVGKGIRRALRQQVQGNEGCLRSLVSMGAMMVMVALCAPLFLAFHASDVRGLHVHAAPHPAWMLVSVPAALLFASKSLTPPIIGGLALGAVSVALQLVVSPTAATFLLFMIVAALLIVRGSARTMEGLR